LAKGSPAATGPKENVMVDFESCFSEEMIIRELCRLRAKKAKKRNDELFLDRIAVWQSFKHEPRSAGNGSWDIFPPRRLWHQYRPRPKARVNASAFDLNVESVFMAAMDLRERTPTAPWVQRLNAKVNELQARVFQPQDFSFRPPRVIAIEKNRGVHEYRPLALFCPEDRIIDSLVARYLRRVLDRVLSPCCLAFRPGSTRGQPPTIHDALEAILEINARNRDSGLYVAECDIRAFFDSVSHGAALAALDEAVSEAEQVVPTLSLC
jgi:hypothetical protein